MMGIDWHRSHNGRETNEAVPTSVAFRKRRLVFAWRGASIGAVMGILVVGSMALFVVKSSNKEAGEGMGYLLEFLGAPTISVLVKVLRILTTVANKIGLPSQWVGMVMGPLITLLSIPLNWGMFGFVIGWLVGNFPKSSQAKIP